MRTAIAPHTATLECYPVQENTPWALPVTASPLA